MLLRRVTSLPEGPDWQYQVKWDGYRMQALNCNANVRLLSRNGADYTCRFPDIAAAVSRFTPTTLHLDGELVAMDHTGRPSFQILQSRAPLPRDWQTGAWRRARVITPVSSFSIPVVIISHGWLVAARI